jgi:probable HAF family extracellular repeat protein
MRLNQTKAMILLTVLFSSGTAFAQSYIFERLTPLSGGRASYAQSINNSGVVVGTTQFDYYANNCGGGCDRATIWNSSVAMAMGFSGRHTYAYDINDSGQAVGYGVPGYTTDYDAYKWNSLTQEATRLSSSYDYDTAWAINNLGQVAGNVSNSSPGSGSAVVWDSNGNATYLGYRSGFFGLDINDAGLVVGNVDGRAAIWNSKLATVTYLEALGDTSGTARAINDMGQVVGNSQVTGGTHATLWNGSSIVDLGTLGGSQLFCSSH